MSNPIEFIYKIFIEYPDIITDSRLIKENSLFWALKGDHFNGNDFVLKALDLGAAYAITSAKDNCVNDKIILVDDTLTALQQLASMHRDKLKAKVLGITGTNGKTTTKELVNSVLERKYKVTATKGNFNNHIGLPLTILSAGSDCEVLILEMGANHAGEIAELCKIGKPDYGIITNIGKAHLEGFGDYETIIDTKRALYDCTALNNGLLLVNSDNELLMKLSDKYNRLTFGKGINADCKVFKPDLSVFAEIAWEYNNISGYAKTNLIGDYNFENIAAAVSAGLVFEVPAKDIEIALNNYKPSNNRSQYLETSGNRIVLDCYNANPTSMSLAISNFAASPFDNKIVILGDMLELGSYSSNEHINIIKQIDNCNFEDVILVGKEFSLAKNTKKYNSFLNTGQAGEYLKQKNYMNKTILVKGSRGIRLESLLEFL